MSSATDRSALATRTLVRHDLANGFRLVGVHGGARRIRLVQAVAHRVVEVHIRVPHEVR